MFRLDAYKIYLFIMGMRRLSMTAAFTVIAIYLVRVVGVDALQFALPASAYEIATFLFEIPTGIVADVYSRRLSIIIGFAVMGAGIIVAVLIPVLWMVVFGLVIAGIGSTFLSGAVSAWIVDEIGQERASQAFIRRAQIEPLFSLAGIILSVLIASISLRLSIASGGICFILTSVILMVIMPETGFQAIPSDERQSWTDLFKTFRDAISYIRMRRIFLLIFIATLLFGAFGEAYGQLWALVVLENFRLPEIAGFGEELWFGIIRAGGIPVTMIAAEIVRRRINLSDSVIVLRTLTIVCGALIISVLLVTLSPVFLVVLIALWLTGMLLSIASPLMETWINQHIASNVRATVLSVNGQVNALGEIAGGPVFGFIGTLSSVRIALRSLTLLMVILIVLFNRVPATPTADKAAG